MSTTGQTLRRWLIRASILAALAAGFVVLREPVACFVFMRSLPDDAIVYVRGGSIRIMSLDGAGRCPLVSRSEGQRLYMLSNSPDGQRFAFIVEDERENSAWIEIASADGSGRTRITPPTIQELPFPGTVWYSSSIDTALSWSPDSERLVFAAGRFANSQLYVWSSAQGVQPIPNSDGALFGFWSLDGDNLLFITDPLQTQRDEMRAFALERIRIDGSERRVLVDDVRYDLTAIQALPDGSIAYLSMRNEVIAVDPQTGEQRAQIAFDRYYALSFVLSPDGAQFAISAWDARHQRPTSLDSSDEVILLIDRGAASEADARVLRRDANNIPSSEVFGWSPDGANVYYLKGTLSRRLTLASGEELTLDDGIDFRFWRRGGR